MPNISDRHNSASGPHSDELRHTSEHSDGFRPRHIPRRIPGEHLNGRGNGAELTLKHKLAIGAFTVFSAIGLIHAASDHESVTLPDATTVDGRKDIAEGIEDGKLVEVRYDPEHMTIASMADSLTPNDQDYRPLQDALVNQNGDSTNVQNGQSAFVPTSPEALRLHNEQFEDTQSHG